MITPEPPPWPSAIEDGDRGTREMRSIVSMRAFSAARLIGLSGSAAAANIGVALKTIATKMRARVRSMWFGRRTIISRSSRRKIEPIAGVQVLAEVDNDLQPFDTGDFDIDRLRRIRRRSRSRAAGGHRRKWTIAHFRWLGRLGRCRPCARSVETRRQPIDHFGAAADSESFVERARRPVEEPTRRRCP